MMGLIGIALTFAMVFGGYLLAGGKIGIVLKALPFELMMIGGAAAGAFLVGNSLATVKHTGSGLAKVFRGEKWSDQDYKDILFVLSRLIDVSSKSPVALEQHIDNPDSSDIFMDYPKILGDKEVLEVVCDTLRSLTMNYNDPHQVEELLDRRLESILEHKLHVSHALQVTADALPALGIVAAVLGVIKTMASIDQPPEVLGKLIGGALVGTFLGVFLAYGVVAPFANRLKEIYEEEHRFLRLIRDILIANLHQHPLALSIEVGRQGLPENKRPSFDVSRDILKEAKK